MVHNNSLIQLYTDYLLPILTVTISGLASIGQSDIGVRGSIK